MGETGLKPKILLVDDKPQNLYALEKLLSKLEVQLIKTTSGLEALKLTLKQVFCLAIIDVQMPEMDGYELVELLRGNESTETLPVIFVSAIYSDEYYHRKAYDAGAVDFLSKPFNPDILLSKVKIFLDLYRQRVKLQEMVNQLDEANHALSKLNVSKDKFFSIVAHDLRSPFNPLLGLAQIMMKMPDTTLPQEFREMGQDIYRSARNVYNLLENLLEWSRLQQDHIKYKPERLVLKQIVKEIGILLTEVAISKGVGLQNAIPDGVLVYADENMLHTVIRNLTSNALKFTSSGDQVIISVGPSKVDSDLAEVSVSDTGVGISPEDQTKLFNLEATHTARGTAQEKGTGLGLIICQEMVEKNGGQIWLESKGIPGQGTTVKFTVPLAENLTEVWQTKPATVTEAKTKANETEPERMIAPPSKEITILHDLALRGNMIEIHKRATQIEQLDAKYKAFTDKLQHLAKAYADEELLALIEQYMEENR